MFKFIIILVVLLCSSSCAVMNTSVLETADTIDEGETKWGVEMGTGIDLVSTVFIEDDPIFTFEEIQTLKNFGFKFGKGISDGNELNGKLWIAASGVGGKFYWKHRLTEKDATLGFAITPGLNFVSSATDFNFGGDNEDLPTIFSFGIDLPIIASYRMSDGFALYGSTHYSIDFLSIDYDESDISDNHVVHRVGVTGGLSFEIKAFYFRPEIGLEGGKTINSGYSFVPNVNFGIGFEF